MPYVLLHENLLIGAIGVLIVGLLIFRVWLSRKRRWASDSHEKPHDQHRH
jgi:hypothetical protein